MFHVDEQIDGAPPDDFGGGAVALAFEGAGAEEEVGDAGADEFHLAQVVAVPWKHDPAPLCPFLIATSPQVSPQEDL